MNTPLQTSASGFRMLTAFILCAGVFLSGCTTLQNVPFPIQPGQSVIVRVGDEIKVRTKAGEVRQVDIVEIQADAFVGKGGRVAFDDIAVLEVQRIDKVRTALLFGLIVVVAAGALVATVPGPLLTAVAVPL
ncbi:MAG: hypothetical protein Q7S40_23290 [Opitutaceae bacterium]|nr:hypothetical protein [Opitutaceae bacterium]